MSDLDSIDEAATVTKPDELPPLLLLFFFGAGGPLGSAGAGFLEQYLGVGGTVLIVAGMLAIVGVYVTGRAQLRRAVWLA